jgi:hypothetical protein
MSVGQSFDSCGKVGVDERRKGRKEERKSLAVIQLSYEH